MGGGGRERREGLGRDDGSERGERGRRREGEEGGIR